jgi:hypothetical protein
MASVGEAIIPYLHPKKGIGFGNKYRMSHRLKEKDYPVMRTPVHFG